MRKAFTLIELLVVIAIIAILAAILFPVFAQAKEAAKKTTCLSNTKQMAIGLYLYTGDSDDTLPMNDYEQNTAGFPQTFNPTNPNSYQIQWTFLVQPYIKNWNIFVCPSDPRPFPTDKLCTNGIQDVGVLYNGVQTCDWAAQYDSYIPVYNAMPAHDWTTVSLSVYNSPSSQAVVTEHRLDSASQTDANAGDGHKGTSGFWPSQPCGQLNPNLALPSPTSASKGNAQSTATGYTYFNAAFLQTAWASAQAAGPIGSKAMGTFFKAYDAVRVAWDRHTSGQGANYAFADGHAKYQNLGQITNPTNYELGDHWYPTQAVWNTSPCQ